MKATTRHERRGQAAVCLPCLRSHCNTGRMSESKPRNRAISLWLCTAVHRPSLWLKHPP